MFNGKTRFNHEEISQEMLETYLGMFSFSFFPSLFLEYLSWCCIYLSPLLSCFKDQFFFSWWGWGWIGWYIPLLYHRRLQTRFFRQLIAHRV